MARGKTPDTPRRNPPTLTVSRSEAQQQITDRITKGSELLNRQISRREELEEAERLVQKWGSYNTELLQRLFDNDVIVNEYNRFASAGFMRMYESLGEDIRDFRTFLSERITRLEAILERLPLIPEPRGQVLTAPTPRREFMSNDIANVDHRAVFLVSGRNEKARIALATFLRAINLRPIEWSEAVALTGEASPFVGTVIEAGFNTARAVVVMLTGDDLARLRPELMTPSDSSFERKETPQARANVLFEAGYAFARHPERTVIVEIGDLRPFSDVQGRHVVRLDNSQRKRQDLAHRLQTAGCDVNLTGVDWHTAGDFESVGP